MSSLAVVVFLLGGESPRAETIYTPRNSGSRVQAVVDDLRLRLSIPHEVLVTVVATNARLISVEAAKDRKGAFLLSLDDVFLGTLSPEEIEAAVAHELGHVWIFTNHPFMQTEQLANRVAMQVINRETMVRLYEKIWTHTGRTGNLESLLGTTSAPAAPPAVAEPRSAGQSGRAAAAGIGNGGTRHMIGTPVEAVNLSERVAAPFD